MIIFGLGFVLGLLIGSLVDCLANRSLSKQSFWGRSYCERCKKTLKWYDLLPVISYLLLQGKCRYCKKRIPPETFITEVAMGFVVGLIFLRSLPANFVFSNNPSQWLLLANIAFQVFIATVMVILLITDLKKGLIPDRISKPASLIAVIYVLIVTGIKVYLEFVALKASPLGRYLLPPQSDFFIRHALLDSTSLVTSILSALSIGLFFGLIILVTRGRGMGGGDLKLGFFIGLALGFPASFLAIFISFILGSVVGVALIFSGRKHFGQTIPFGPFLSLGTIIALLFSNQIIGWYITTFPHGSIF